MNVNEEKRSKFIECAGKRVNNVLHDMQILEPMARSSVYDFTKQDIEEMFSAMQETLNNTRAEFEKKFEEKVRSEKKVFSFGKSNSVVTPTVESVNEVPVMAESNDSTVISAMATAESVDNEVAIEENQNETAFSSSVM